VGYTLSVPNGLRLIALISARTYHTSVAQVLMYSPGVAGATPSMNNPFTLAGFGPTIPHAEGQPFVVTLNRNIYARAAAASTHLYITTNGWIDHRGRYD